MPGAFVPLIDLRFVSCDWEARESAKSDSNLYTIDNEARDRDRVPHPTRKSVKGHLVIRSKLTKEPFIKGMASGFDVNDVVLLMEPRNAV
jgi:hypothetical protein